MGRRRKRYRSGSRPPQRRQRRQSRPRTRKATGRRAREHSLRYSPIRTSPRTRTTKSSWTGLKKKLKEGAQQTEEGNGTLLEVMSGVDPGEKTKEKSDKTKE